MTCNPKSDTGGAAGARTVPIVLVALAGALLATPSTLPASVTTADAANPDCDWSVVAPDRAAQAVRFVAATVADAHAPGIDRDAATLQGLQALEKSLRQPIGAPALVAAINRELAASRDAHLRIDLRADVATRCRSLPFRLAWSDRGLLVTSSDGQIPEGARISSLGGRSLEELETLALQQVPHENAYWARSELARMVVRDDWARALGLVDANAAVAVRYQTAGGEVRQASVELQRPTKTDRPWVGYELFPEQSTGLFWMDRCDPSEEFLRTLDEFVAAVRRADVRKVAIDVRRNPGGDVGAALAVFRAFGLAVNHGFTVHVRVSDTLLASMPMFAPAAIAPAFGSVGLPAPAPDARSYQVPPALVLGLVQSRLGDRAYESVSGRELFLLTGGGTFSSAALFAVLVRDNALGRIVGEPIGNSASFNGSVVTVPIPGMLYELHVSTATLVRPDPLAGTAPSVLPDVLAPATAQSLREGTDPALDYVRSVPVTSPRPGPTTAHVDATPSFQP